MKKKLVVALAATMLATTLFGCGKDTSATTTNETTDSSSTESVEDTNASTSNDSGTLGDALGIEDTESTETTSTNVSWAGNEYIDSYGWKFPDNEYGTIGYTTKYVIDDKTSDCVTHVETSAGTMDFVWSGPVGLGENASPSSNGVWLYDSNTNYKFDAWSYGNINDEEFDEMLALDKNTLISYNSIPYVENGYFNISASDTLFEVIFEISDNEYKGYAYYIADKKLGECYQFNYVEKVSIYDDTRAKSVIDSIDFATNVIDDYESLDISSNT